MGSRQDDDLREILYPEQQTWYVSPPDEDLHGLGFGDAYSS